MVLAGLVQKIGRLKRIGSGFKVPSGTGVRTRVIEMLVLMVKRIRIVEKMATVMEKPIVRVGTTSVLTLGIVREVVRSILVTVVVDSRLKEVRS